jgi:hypothetical protein
VSARVRVAVVLQALSAAALGVLLGASIAEGALLVPWWRALPPSAFLTWYAGNAERLLGFFAPLTTVATVLTFAAAVAGVAMRMRGRVAACLAAVLVVLVVAGFFLYFEDANRGFATGSVALGDVPAALAAWARWHWVRVAVMAVAFAASLWSLGLGGPMRPGADQSRRSG